MSRSHPVLLLTGFMILCGCGGTGSALPTVTLFFSPTSTPAGQIATLTWASANDATCIASGAWSGTQPVNGTLSITPSVTGTQTYSLSCKGAGGETTSSATLVVTAPKPPAVIISISPAQISANQSATLTWTTTDATSCNATGDWNGPQPTSGSQNLTPSAIRTLSFILACSGIGGNTTSTATLRIAGSSAACAMPNAAMRHAQLVSRRRSQK